MLQKCEIALSPRRELHFYATATLQKILFFLTHFFEFAWRLDETLVFLVAITPKWLFERHLKGAEKLDILGGRAGGMRGACLEPELCSLLYKVWNTPSPAGGGRLLWAI